MKLTENKPFIAAASGAAAFLLLLAGSLLGAAPLLWPLLALMALTPASEDCSLPAGLAAYALSAALSMLALPSKVGATIFLLLGYYPIIRPRIAAVRLKYLRAAIRFGIIVVSSCMVYALVWWLYPPESASLAGEGGLLLGVFLLGGAIYFLLYDFILSRCSMFYLKHIKKGP